MKFVESKWQAHAKIVIIIISSLFFQDFGSLHKRLLIIIYNAQVDYGSAIKAL